MWALLCAHGPLGLWQSQGGQFRSPPEGSFDSGGQHPDADRRPGEG